MRLLPRNCSFGWTPYAWLIYLPIFLADPLSRHASAGEWTATAAAVALFLALYFAGYWLAGAKLLLVIAALVALAAGFAPWNPNSGVFVIYAAAFAGKLAPPRWAMAALAAMSALVAIETWLLRLPVAYWAPSILFGWVVGGVNIHFSEVGRAAERLRESQEEVQQLARIAERERIARDLHDLLGHTLSVIALKAELAGKLLATSPERAAAEIRDVESVTRDALREVRSAVAGYRSEGLTAELARARLALDAAGVRAEYFTLPVQLPPAAEAALALAVREAVTNVIRHAGATVCRLTLDRLPGATLLEVADDGRGGAGEKAGGGCGLRAMRERLSGLGGQVEIRPSVAGMPGGGTCLSITLPYRPWPAAVSPPSQAPLAAPARPAARLAASLAPPRANYGGAAAANYGEAVPASFVEAPAPQPSADGASSVRSAGAGRLLPEPAR
jgi:two-component system, NarL family, sensor histidine kinase DesK